ncbi:SIMPL domain-containing protein [Novosphingobium sp.]|uniref:SIMPL domain-containing protein n=1 Tax=Novosphingobium sp. TaxID=1874826 RepID=UPI001D3148FB|nr:SIMPL domain-containing protein [Novosphingobium sp.]MBX9662360.1 SIMPL domain-containing protein [Novosphingobium sp.]
MTTTSTSLLMAAALAAAGAASPAMAQAVSPAPVVAPGNAVLTLSADGRSTRTPDLAVFSAGVTTQAKTAAAALSENADRMNAVITALKASGIAERDIQTSNLSVNPVYGQPRADANGNVSGDPVIIGYQASNQVEVKQRKIGNYGKTIDTLVNAGANQVSGPSFQLDNPDVASDEARIEAMKKARARAELYAKAAGLTVKRILTISESGGYAPQPMVMYARAEKMMAGAPSPVAAGEVQVGANVTVTFELGL